jgi:hypothetical protein
MLYLRSLILIHCVVSYAETFVFEMLFKGAPLPGM